MTIRIGLRGMETLGVETKSNKKGKVRCFFPPRIGRNEGDGERCTEPRGVALQPARFAYLCRTFFACHLYHHLTLTCSFCMPRPSVLLLLPFARDAPLRSVFA